MDPEKSREKLGKTYAVTPVALTYKNKKRTETYFEPLISMSVTFTVEGTVFKTSMLGCMTLREQSSFFGKRF